MLWTCLKDIKLLGHEGGYSVPFIDEYLEMLLISPTA